jgi:hypothetical protein
MRFLKYHTANIQHCHLFLLSFSIANPEFPTKTKKYVNYTTHVHHVRVHFMTKPCLFSISV